MFDFLIAFVIVIFLVLVVVLGIALNMISDYLSCKMEYLQAQTAYINSILQKRDSTNEALYNNTNQEE